LSSASLALRLVVIGVVMAAIIASFAIEGGMADAGSTDVSRHR